MSVPRRRSIAAVFAALTVVALTFAVPAAYAEPTPEPSATDTPSPSDSTSQTSDPTPEPTATTPDPSPSSPTATPTAPPTSPPTGTATISGRITDNGTPVAGLGVFANPTQPFGTQRQSTTDGNGAFLITNVVAGTYRVNFRLTLGSSFSFRDWYSPSAPVFSLATIYTITDGGSLVLNESMPAYGTLTGVLTRSDGTPVSGVSAQAQGTIPGSPFAIFVGAVTDINGRYTIPFTWVANYIISFRPAGAPQQYAHGKLSNVDADIFPVTAGQTTTVDEVLLATGNITGRLTSQGQPISFAFVQIFTPIGQQRGSGVTGTDGSYRIAVPAGTYVVQFRLPNGGQQYAHNKATLAEAEQFTVVVGQDTVVDEQVAVPATIRGTVRNPDGTPATLRSVFISGDQRTFIATLGPNGTYQASVQPGTYVVSFSTDLGGQYAFGKSAPETADRITVAEGQTAVVDDVLAPPGTLVVTAKDRRTGTAITTFCLNVSRGGFCATDGIVTITAMPGRVRGSVVDPDQIYYPENIDTEIVSGQTTTLVVEMSKAATLTTVIKDAATGAPVPSACLHLVEILRPTTLGNSPRGCSDANGVVTIRPLRAGVVNGFVEVRDGVHGMQWVGLNRGTGAMLLARPIILPEGGTVNLPAIKLDKAGSITGIVRDAETGQPLRNAYVSLSSVSAGFGPSGIFTNTDGDGRYRLDNLGPYNWTLYFNAFGPYATVFSGGTGDRFLAKGVPVQVGQTTTYDQPMKAGTILTGTVTYPFIGPARITLVHALSADELKAIDVASSGGTYSLNVAGPLLVKLMVNQQWVGGEDFLHAQVFLVDASGITTVNVDIS